MSNTVDYSEHDYSCEVNASAADAGGIESAEPVQNSPQAKSWVEMRSSPRKKYQVNQQIGPMHGGFLPTTDEYFNVECNDISKGGISFYLKRPPGCEQFAIVLGQKPEVTILIAKVVYARQVEHGGQRMYLVGCQFIGRVIA